MCTAVSLSVCGNARAQDKITEMKADGDYVVLIHGVTKWPNTMAKAARHLNSQGFHTIQIDYPATRFELGTLIDRYIHPVVAGPAADKSRRVHFVGHSMGCIVIRHYLTERRPPNLGRVVMLAPPNSGIKLIDSVGTMRLVKWYTGPVGQQLGTGKDSLPNRLGPIDYETGVIMGRNPHYLYFLSPITGYRGDGILRVRRGRVEGAKAFTTVNTNHIELNHNPEVSALACAFLKSGKFLPKKERAKWSRKRAPLSMVACGRFTQHPSRRRLSSGRHGMR